MRGQHVEICATVTNCEKKMMREACGQFDTVATNAQIDVKSSSRWKEGQRAICRGMPHTACCVIRLPLVTRSTCAARHTSYHVHLGGEFSNHAAVLPATCSTLQQSKTHGHHAPDARRTPLKQTGPLETISMDKHPTIQIVIGPLPRQCSTFLRAL